MMDEIPNKKLPTKKLLGDEPSGRCLWPWHSWGPWEEEDAYTLSIGLGDQKRQIGTKWVQVRRCKKCNVAERKVTEIKV